MIALQVELEVKEEATEEVRMILQELAQETRAEDGCIFYAPCQSVEEPHRFFVWERWESAADIKAHKETQHYKDAIQTIASFVERSASHQCRNV